MKSFRRVLALLLLLPLLATAQDDRWANARAEFVAALARVSAADTDADDSKLLRGYVLYPYLVAARLQARLSLPTVDADTDASLRAFVADHATLPVTAGLQRSWLRSLAQRQQWAALITAYDPAVADADLRCQYLQARINTDDATKLEPEVEQVWLTAQSLPNSCDTVFDWARAKGWLTPQRIEQRARLALDAGNASLAEFLARDLPTARAEPVQRWARLIRTPQQELDVLIAQPQAPVEAAALLDGYSRLARNDPDAALQRYQPLLAARHLDGTDAAPYTAALALGLAWSRRPEAVDYFSRLPESAADDRVHEWRVRAALWNGDWARANEWLQRLPPALATQDRWTYWRARAMDSQPAQREQAKALYQRLTAQNNVFGVFAAWRLGKPHLPTPEPQTLDAKLQAALLANDAVIRARELHLADREDWSAAEWRRALDGATPALRLQAGLLAASWGWHGQAIATLATASVYDDFNVTYPLPFSPVVTRAQSLSGLPAPVIYGVIRQESLFNPEAVSRADALGLMQLLLPTARHVAKRWSLPSPSRSDLFRPEVNIELGAAHLRDLVDSENGNLMLALGAYNAGPRAVARWVPESRPVDADIWVENVPYNETRSYIQRILWHIAVFGWKESGEPQDLKTLLKPVGPAQ